MNRFFRSALFPLVIIAALVWLALQTLGHHSTKNRVGSRPTVHSSGRYQPPAGFRQVVIDPNKQSISATVGGQPVSINYGSPNSEFANLERR